MNIDLKEVIKMRENFKFENGKWISKNHDATLELSRQAHGEFLPDDFKYKIIVKSLDNIIEQMEYDSTIEYIDCLVEPSIYTSELTHWLASHINRLDYLDKAIEEFQPKDAFHILATAQYLEISEIFDSVVSYFMK